VDAISKICGARKAAAGGLHQRRRRLREPGKPRVRDRLIEDAGLALLVLDRRQISYEDALEGLVRDAFGSADRLRAAVAEARASGRPDAELDLLERAADRVRLGGSRPIPASPSRPSNGGVEGPADRERGDPRG
jgi:hypothetical protein